jgi:flagellar biosynthetic protein FliQ
MTPDTVVDITQNALLVLLMVGSPLLLSALAIGLLIGMIQAATQVNEMTLSFIPKILVLVATLFMVGPWILQTMIDYSQRLIGSIPSLIG